LHYVGRRFEDFIGVVDSGSVWAPDTRMDPGPDGILGTADDGGVINVFRLQDSTNKALVVANPSNAFRRYEALQVVGRKRYSRNWQMSASYTWSWNQGNVSSGGGYANAELDHYDLGYAGAFIDPNHLVNKTLPFHASELKFAGIYQLTPFGGATFSAVFRRSSGAPLRRTAAFRGLAPRAEFVIVDTQTSRYYDTLQTLDARVEKTFPVNGSSLGIYLDFLNLTNQGVATAVTTLSGNAFGQPFLWSDPRIVRAGVRFQF